MGTYAIIPSGVSSSNYTITFNNGTLTVIQAAADVVLSGLATTFNFTAQAATATTIPPGLNTTITYNGSAVPPTNAGSYTVIAAIADPNYRGIATDTLVIAKATPVITWIDPAPIVGGTALSPTGRRKTDADGIVRSRRRHEPQFDPCDSIN